MAAEFEAIVVSRKLPVGTKLVCTTKGRKVTAEVVLHEERPALRVGRKFFRSPSLAGIEATGHRQNGWATWKLPSGEPLASIRPKKRATTPKRKAKVAR